ncbi:MAG: tripartite tricarboxylate transporter substrate binding protein [Betaproteobacteria bacterium]|nr:tripartite tricarboxylate transporter substrate binding protein [Betaproteobacteria bacterium]
MNHMRRIVLATAGMLAALTAPPAMAQSDYPNKFILFMVPQAVGGSTDLLSRTVGQKLAVALGQPVTVDNRAGANGIIGCELVAKAAPNGYTLLVGGTGSMAINPSLYPKLSYDPVRQFTPVAMFGYSTSVLVVHPSMTPATIGELIALARSKPGQYKYASAGFGSSPHLSAEMFKQMAGAELLHVPYKGSTPGVSATITGETDLMFTGVASAVGHIKSGRLRALSINGPRRSPALPGVPTADESGLPGFEADFWIGLFAPAGTPRAAIDRLNAEVNKIMTEDAMKERLMVIGVDPAPGSPEQFGDILAKDIDRWSKAVRSAGLKPE